MLKNYLKISPREITELITISATLGLLFSLTFMRFSDKGSGFFNVLITFIIFIFLLFSGRLLFMKYVAYRNGFEIEQHLTYFDRYWFRNYDRISYTMGGSHMGVKTPKIEGIPIAAISIVIFIFSLGLIIFPSMWRYKIKKIPHRFIGTKHKFEHTFSQTENVTMYRFSKVLFSGYLYYLFISYFIKILFSDITFTYYYWFMFIIYYVAFFTLIPIIGTEGFEFWLKGRFGWLSAITILFLGVLSLLILNSLSLVLITTIISVLIVIIFMLWREII